MSETIATRTDPVEANERPLTSASPIEIRIRPSRSWWDVDWQGLLHYQDLLWLLVRRDFVSKYKQTVLGPAWMLIQPLATTFVFTVIFSKVAKLSTDGVPAPLFYLSGLLGWNLFAGVFGSTGNVLQSNAGLFGKVYFPRLVVPLANTVSALIPFVIQMGAFLVLSLSIGGVGAATEATEVAWLARLLLFPLCLFQILLIGLGVGLLFSSSTAVYRDLQHLLGFAMQMWMYLTPVIYPLSQFPEKWRWLPFLNPLSAPLEGIRIALLGVGTQTAASWTISWALTLAISLVGFAAFNRTEKDFIDRA